MFGNLKDQIYSFDKLPIDIIQVWEKYKKMQNLDDEYNNESDNTEQTLMIEKLDKGKEICIKTMLNTLQGIC